MVIEVPIAKGYVCPLYSLSCKSSHSSCMLIHKELLVLVFTANSYLKTKLIKAELNTAGEAASFTSK